jgi:biopolymer transport protein ExbD
MAISTQNGGSRGRHRFHGQAALSEMNVVPLVDVVLVLLIIFMLTAHVMEFGMEIDVPKVKMEKESAQELPIINITKDGEIALNDKPININSIKTELEARFTKKGSRAVYVRADKATPFDPIAQVISALGQAKMDVRLVTQPEDSAGRKGR